MRGILVTRLVLVLLVCAVVGSAAGCGQTVEKADSGAVPAPAQAATTSPTVAPPSTGDSNPQTDKVTVPDLVNRGMTSARMNLGANHLTYLVVTDPPDADLPMDNSVVIVKQSPEAGTVVDSGTQVTLTIRAK